MRHLSYANVAATLALVFAMGGGAIAATGGFGSGGVLQACVNNEGRIRLVKSGRRCPRGQQKVAWNQTGPAGPKGATGATGATGPAGPKGSDGAPGESGEVKWGLIGTSGNLIAGHGIVASRTSGNHYVIAFDRAIDNCAVVATANVSAEALVTSASFAGTEAKVLMQVPGEPAIVANNPFSIVVHC